MPKKPSKQNINWLTTAIDKFMNNELKFASETKLKEKLESVISAPKTKQDFTKWLTDKEQPFSNLEILSILSVVKKLEKKREKYV